MLLLHCRSYTYPAMLEPAVGPLEVWVEHGEPVGVMGPNESGKSTLGLLLAGMAPGVIGGHLDGELTIDGASMRGRPSFEVAQHVGYLAPNPATQLSHLSRTVFEEVALGPMNLGLPRGEILDRVDDVMRELDLTDLAWRDPRLLSGGQAQLVAMASLLAMRPSHLVLDEPTSQLDPAGTLLVRAALERLVNRGTALVVIEHKADLLDDLCRRILVLADGRIVDVGPAESILAGPALERLGIPAPSRVRLGRLAAAEGVPLDPLRLAAALRDEPCSAPAGDAREPTASLPDRPTRRSGQP